MEDRLHRIEGQIRGIENMIEQEEDLRKIVVQVQAVISGLESVKLEMVKKQISNNLEEQVISALDLLK